MRKRDQIPKVVVNLYVKYHDGREIIIPCHSWDECGSHEMHFCGRAETERRPVNNWKSVGEVTKKVIEGMQKKCQETE